ncbi:HNH endonuclease [Fulvivirga sedimenti]|uniref:HNH endonuclease n=1 Tax=Fulvivirga sedimenti TaxID=2879465 RepID=A0A9X1HNU2_9BACT|nr:HNH endonuclease signature motif containing protein [Fulvivirga sedimenti]MCA6075594.1 HNH endonuclease [Fulvivirga sedimenti]
MQEYDLVRYWKNCLDKNNNSYKFVFALVLLDHIRTSKHLILSYETIADSFVKFYWDQTVVFKLNHAVNPRQMLVFIQLIRDINPPEIFYKNAKSVYKNELNETREYLLSRKMRTLRNPISRFQSEYKVIDDSSGDKTGSGFLYHWDEDKREIRFNEEPFRLIKKNLWLFKDITVYYFVQFLERNNSIPKIHKKLGLDNSRSAIKTELRRIILQSSEACFYCENELRQETHIDHFIPWSFILEHDKYNLVPACSTCNNGVNGKMALLPKFEFIEKLTDRNLEIFGDEPLTHNKNQHIELQWRTDRDAGYRVW